MNYLKTSRFALILIMVFALILTTIFFISNPQDVGLFGVLAVVIAMYGIFTGVILLVSSLFMRRKRRSNRGQNAPLARDNSKQQVGICAVLALAPTLLIILNSLGTIGVIEIALIVVFEGVVIFLIRKRD